MTKTIEDMKAAKRQLEQDILKRLQEFEKSYGVGVDCVRTSCISMTVSQKHIQMVDIVAVL